ncbi:MAG: Gp15 family bacteriophage protein [Clostridia bacterium]
MYRNNLAERFVELTINGGKFEYSTDYRLFVDYCNIATNNGDISSFIRANKLPLNEKTILEINGLYFEQQPDEKTDIKDKSNKKSAYTFKYDVLWELIFSAFWEKYQIDLDIADLHFKKFKMLLNGVKDTKLNEVLECWGTPLQGLKKEERAYNKSVRNKYPLGATSTNETLEQRNNRMIDYVKKRNKELNNG